MDKLTSQTLSNERLLIQWAIPGMVVLLPYYILINMMIPSIWSFLSGDKLILSFSYIVLSIGLGLVLEIIGSYIEVGCFDNNFENALYSENHPETPGKPKFPHFRKDWEVYLGSNFKKDEEPVVLRYIRSVLFKMKFELALGLALALMLPGLVIIKMVTNFYINPILFASIILFFFWSANRLVRVEARNSAYVLQSCRRRFAELLEEQKNKQSTNDCCDTKIIRVSLRLEECD